MNNTTMTIISAIFIIAGSWFLSFLFCGAGAAGSSSYFSVVDGELNTKKVDPFLFKISGTKATIPKETETEFKKVANHLKNNEDRALSLVGNYYISENTKGDVDLGIARAEAIQSKLEKLGAPEGSINISSRRLNNIETGDKNLYNAVDFVFAEKKTNGMSDSGSSSEALSSGSDMMSGFVIPFKSGKSDFDNDSKFNEFLETAKTYIADNPSGKVVVTGYSSSVKSATTMAKEVRRVFRSNEFKRENLDYNGVVESELSEGDPLYRRVVLVME